MFWGGAWRMHGLRAPQRLRVCSPAPVRTASPCMFALDGTCHVQRLLCGKDFSKKSGFKLQQEQKWQQHECQQAMGACILVMLLHGKAC